jgi:uncharacterized protein YeaO (DUF488 family)
MVAVTEAIHMKSIRTKRVYEPPDPSDGQRVLVDRLWPRGLTKERARVDVWLRDIAPSDGLRKWFGHVPERWEEFKRRYHRELDGNGDAVSRLRAMVRDGPVTLLFGAKDEERNQAIALKEYLERQHFTHPQRTKSHGNR